MRKNVGIPNCFIIAKISDLNIFQEAGVPLIVVVKLSAWLLAAKSLTVSLNFTLLKLPAFNAPVTFRIAILICCCKPTFCKIFRTKKKSDSAANF